MVSEVVAMPSVTVCTPTWNRRHTLDRVYRSLKAQSVGGFEWLVVDDGSTDGTADLVSSWARDCAFPIHYVRQENAGKHVAVRTGAGLARGELMLVADSDDEFLPTTVELFLEAWRAIPAGEQGGYCGVACLCQDSMGRVVGDAYPQGLATSDFASLHFKYRLQGEKWWVVRTDLMRRFAGAGPEGARQVPEGVTWFRMAREYQVRLLNAPLRIYHHGRTGEARLMTTPPATYAPGGAYYARMVLNEEWRWFRYSPRVFVQAAINFTRFSLHQGTAFRDQWRALRVAPRALWLSCVPVGSLAWAVDRRRAAA